MKPRGSIDPDATKELAENGHVDLEQPERDQGKPHEDPHEEKPPFPATATTPQAQAQAQGRRRGVIVVQREVDGVPTEHVETDCFCVGKDGEVAFEDSKPHHERDEVGPTK